LPAQSNPRRRKIVDGVAAVNEIANAVGGKIESAGVLPDGSGFATVSIPLPKNHWLYEDKGFNVPPMPFRMGTADAPRMNMTREMWADALREAGKYAYRCATMNGKEQDLDPDALLQNLVVGFLGYWTPNGLSSDEWANPKEL
jgi:hypothetical protein